MRAEAVTVDQSGAKKLTCSTPHVRFGSCVTSIAGPYGDAQLFERWRRALRVRRSGADSKPPQAAAVKSRGGERCGNVGTVIPAGNAHWPLCNGNGRTSRAV